MSSRDKHHDKGGRLRMDRINPQSTYRINDPSLPAGRRKEIDNVMKKARRDPNMYWDKKLLEVEERDPNRWHHSGFKKLYVDEEKQFAARSRSRSPSISPRPRGHLRVENKYHSSPPRKIHSPSPRKAPEPLRKYRSPSPKPRGSMYMRRPPSPPAAYYSKRKPSTSSSSSSDSEYPRPSTISIQGTSKSSAAFAEKSTRKEPSVKQIYEKPQKTSHKKGSPKPRVTSTSDDFVPSKKKTPQKKSKKVKEKEPSVKVKIEDEPKKRQRSSSTDSSSSDESSSVFAALSSNTKITLSERFGKIAQWSVDRSNMENMRITKNSAGGKIKVSIEDGIQSPEDPRPNYSPARPAGHFPDELMVDGPGDLSWDDVRVRYKYYKDRGYLRGLGLQDYVKWEEWWYQYQDWLRRCEIWERAQLNRRRRKKIPITARLN